MSFYRPGLPNLCSPDKKQDWTAKIEDKFDRLANTIAVLSVDVVNKSEREKEKESRDICQNDSECFYCHKSRKVVANGFKRPTGTLAVKDD